MGIYRVVSGIALSFSLGCGSSGSSTATETRASSRPSQPASVSVDIDIDAERSGHSLVVKVRGLGKNHQMETALENPKAWKIKARHGRSPLRQVLAGPAKIAREPVGRGLGDEWDIEIHFMVAFALPDEPGSVSVEVQAPSGQIAEREVKVDGPPLVGKVGGTRAPTFP